MNTICLQIKTISNPEYWRLQVGRLILIVANVKEKQTWVYLYTKKFAEQLLKGYLKYRLFLIFLEL